MTSRNPRSAPSFLRNTLTPSLHFRTYDYSVTRLVPPRRCFPCCAYQSPAVGVLQTAYFCVALVVDILGQDHDGQRNAAPRGVQKLRNYMFAILAFPIGLFVVLTFWMIYAFDRELIYPTYLDLVIPVWLNHAMHTTVMPLLLLEMKIIPHVYPQRGVGIAGVTSFGICYLIWTLWIRYAGGLWVYPILAWLAGPGLVVFILLGGLVLTGLYVLGEVMNVCLWPRLEGNGHSVAGHKNK